MSLFFSALPFSQSKMKISLAVCGSFIFLPFLVPSLTHSLIPCSNVTYILENKYKNERKGETKKRSLPQSSMFNVMSCSVMCERDQKRKERKKERKRYLVSLLIIYILYFTLTVILPPTPTPTRSSFSSSSFLFFHTQTTRDSSYLSLTFSLFLSYLNSSRASSTRTSFTCYFFLLPFSFLFFTRPSLPLNLTLEHGTKSNK